MILAIAGTYCSGKDIGAEYLAERFGLLEVSTGDMVRAVAKELHGNIERKTLINTANNLRAERGGGVLAKLALEEYEDKQSEFNGVVISGIRSIGETQEILRNGGHLIYVDASLEDRWQRSRKRLREGEEQNLDQFKKNEQRELHGDGDDETVINLLAVKDLADRQIDNKDNLGQYFANLEQYVQTISS